MSVARLNMPELIATCSALPQCNRAGLQLPHNVPHCCCCCCSCSCLNCCRHLIVCVCVPVETRYGVRAFISRARKRAAEILTGNVANNIFNTPSLTNCTHGGRAITVSRSLMTNDWGAGIFGPEWELIE